MKRKITAVLSVLIVLVLIFRLAGCDDAGVTTPTTTSTRFLKSYGAAGQEAMTSMTAVTGGGYVLGGYSIASGAGDNDFLLMKVGGDGNVTWSKTYGGSGNDQCYSVQQTSDGGIVAAGSTTSFGATGFDIYVVKTDGNGSTQWSKIYKLNGDQYVYSMIIDADGSIVMCGTSTQNAGTNTDVSIMKVSSDGTFQWQYLYGETFNDYGARIIKTSDGGFLVCGSTFDFGSTAGDGYLIKLKQDGSYDWSKSYRGDQMIILADVNETSGHDFVSSGSTNSFGLTSVHSIIFKTDHSGNVYTSEGWPRTLGTSSGVSAGSSVIPASDGSFYMTGFMGTSATGADLFVSHYYGNSQYDYTRTYGSGSGADKGMCLLISSTNLVIGGTVTSFGSASNKFCLINMQADSTGKYTACLSDNGLTPSGGSPTTMTVVPDATMSYTATAPSTQSAATIESSTSLTTVTQCGQ